MRIMCLILLCVCVYIVVNQFGMFLLCAAYSSFEELAGPRRGEGFRGHYNSRVASPAMWGKHGAVT